VQERQSFCDRSRLTLSEMTEVAQADHARNVEACRRGLEACDRSTLTRREAVALAVAEHDRNVSDCTGGMGSACENAWSSRDRSRLTPSDVAAIPAEAVCAAPAAGRP
jgi:hypothetical protein